MTIEWNWRVMEIRKNPLSATPEELALLGAKENNLNEDQIVSLTDNWFMGLCQNEAGFINLSISLTSKGQI